MNPIYLLLEFGAATFFVLAAWLALRRGRLPLLELISAATFGLLLEEGDQLIFATYHYADAWVLYGVLDGTESLERYDRIDDGSRPDYAEVKLASVTTDPDWSRPCQRRSTRTAPAGSAASCPGWRASSPASSWSRSPTPTSRR